MAVNEVVVKFQKYIKNDTFLYPKEYTFRLDPKETRKFKVSDRVFVKDNNGKVQPVIIEKLLELPKSVLSKHKSILRPRKNK